ncbi:hypothetical protein BLOT_008022 [Blomia tropicalis]|nr:hypothetical protein BLOT_008022 [Blomia tropicalis]
MTNDNGSDVRRSNKDYTLTFGEFCFFANELINSYRQNIPPPRPLSQSNTFIRKLERAQQISDPPSENETNFDVFLGGSCNPTRWRKEIVIPELKRHGITYYNPQVEHWGPQLIELESYAKQNSEILFFVVDNQTRAIASMIEVAFLASAQRKLILVVNDLPGPKCKIVNDELSVEEYENLIKGRAFLRDVVERQGIPIFSQIPVALKSAIRVLREGIWPQDLTPPEDDIIPVKMGHISLGDKIIKTFKVFESFKNANDQFTFAELRLAYRTLNSIDLPKDLIKQLARCHLENHVGKDSTSSPSLSRSSSSDDHEDDQYEIVGSSTVTKKITKSRSRKNRKLKKLQNIFPSDSTDSIPPLDEIVIDFDQFCCILSELSEKVRQQTETVQSGDGVTSETDQMLARTILQFPSKMLEKVGNIFNVFSIMNFKTMLSISNDDQQQQMSNKRDQQQQQQSSTNVNNRLFIPGGNMNDSNNNKLRPPQIVQQNPHNNHLSHDNSFLLGNLPTKRSSSQIDRPTTFYIDAQHLANIQPNGGSYPYHLRPQQYLPQRSISSSLFHHRHSYSSPHLANHPLYQTSLYDMPSSSSSLRPHASTSSITSLLYDNFTDLYIGGSLEENFLNQNIIPLLKKYSITYSTLKADRWTSQRMIPLEAKNVEKSRVLLFLITKNSIDISFMIMAAHYVGLCYNVVLCIQYIDSSSPFVISDGNKETWLSTDAIKDYNRGRSYLSDLATKVGVPVFSDINESVQNCIEKIQSFD